MSRLGEYLHRFLGTDAQATLVRLPHGYSNLTYELTLGDRRLVLRRAPPGDVARGAHDMLREFRVLTGLRSTFPWCPRVLLYCNQTSVLGCDFYVMEHMDGVVFRNDYPPDLPMPPERVCRQHENFIDTLAELHDVDYARAGLLDFGRPKGYVQRQLEGWVRRYAQARTAQSPDMDDVVRWLAGKLPSETGATLVHNDYKLDNVIWDRQRPDSLIGVLDWELATIGDPMMELGCVLSYWVSKTDPEPLQSVRMCPTNVPGALSRAELVDRYCARRRIRPRHLDFHYCFGFYRLAVIFQQMIRRFEAGEADDPRYATLAERVELLAQCARDACRTGMR